MGDDNTIGNTAPTVSTGQSKKSQGKGKKKESSAILNVIMIIVGLLFVVKGLIDLASWLKLFVLPEWLKTLQASLDSKEAGTALSFLGSQGIISSMLGAWCFVSGILLFRESESGWGMAVVVLSTMAGNGIAAIITWFSTPESFDILYWPNWVVILTTASGILGFFFLLLTRKRYD